MSAGRSSNSDDAASATADARTPSGRRRRPGGVVRNLRAGWTAVPDSATRSHGPRLTTRLLILRGELVEDGVEPLKGVLPVPAVTVEPVTRLSKRSRIEASRPALRIDAARDQSRLFKHLQVLGDCGLRHGKGPGQLTDRGVAGREPGEKRAPRRISKGGERSVETG